MADREAKDSIEEDVGKRPLSGSSSSSSAHHNKQGMKFSSFQLNDSEISPDQWMIEMKQELIAAPLQRSQMKKKKIVLVPKVLHNIRPEAYTPLLLSIGPLNARFTTLSSSMDRSKAHCMNAFLAGCSPPSQLDKLTAFLFQGDNTNPQNDYLDIPNLYNEVTLKFLIAIDSVFLLEFICFAVGVCLDTKVSHCSTPHIWEPFNDLLISLMLRDLSIIGNQVPLSNLVTLAEYRGLSKQQFSLLLWSLISKWNPFSIENNGYRNDDIQKLLPLLQCEHLLACLYKACVTNMDNFQIPISPSHVEEEPMFTSIPRASELCKVGVKFEGVNGNTTVIKYDNNNLTMQLPKLNVGDETECMLRNLIAYEITSECNAYWGVCAYVWLMDSLIDTSDDLAILYKAGVLKNGLGNDEKMLLLWNDICVHIPDPRPKKHQEMIQAIMTHYNTDWRKILVEFQHRYFSRPWYILSVIGALLLLFMTSLQSVYSVLGFYKS